MLHACLAKDLGHADPVFRADAGLVLSIALLPQCLDYQRFRHTLEHRIDVEAEVELAKSLDLVDVVLEVFAQELLVAAFGGRNELVLDRLELLPDLDAPGGEGARFECTLLLNLELLVLIDDSIVFLATDELHLRSKLMCSLERHVVRVGNL